MISFLSDNTAILTLLGLTLLVLLLLAVVIWAAVKGAGQADKPAAPKERRISSDSLRHSFRVAVELIESNLAARNERYNLNWTLVLNEGARGSELPLVQSGLPSALSTDSTLTAAGQGLNWNFFDQGVAIQLQSSYLGSPDAGEGAGNGTWDAFLGLCRNYRPDRPFDAIVLSLPASLFLDAEGQESLNLIARAKTINRRLWLAQNRLALRFPIYVVVSECETIPGFARFSAALPEPLRRSMLGWSSAYELSAPFQAQWVDTAMNEVVRSLSDAAAELSALEPADADSSQYFLLPTQVERLRAGVKLFTDELMRPSAYHEPFLLRGIYLSGDCGDTALMLSQEGTEAPTVLVDGVPDVTELPSRLPEQSPDGPVEPAPGGLPLYDEQAGAMPAFLRDIFERKIFAETGLVRSASSQRMRRPAVNVALRWGALALPAVWILGLGFATVRLTGLSGQMVTSLNNLNREARHASFGLGSTVDPAESNKRAVDALGAIERMDTTHMGSFFMPGSWSWFDALHDRLHLRMEKAFADNAFDPLRRAAYQRVGALTGVPLDPISGTLVAGGRCTLPAKWVQYTAGAGAGALNIEELPEFGAMRQYLDQIEQIDKVLDAMTNLTSPRTGPASGDDLALVVRMLLGVDVGGSPARTAQLFRQVARGAPPMAIAPLQEAAACSFRQASRALTQRLFADNALLRSEQDIGESVRALLDAGPRPADPVAALQAWQKLRTSLRAQEHVIGAGKGAWMHGTTLVLGQAWDDMLTRVEQLDLLGKVPADDARKQADGGFQQFQSAWEQALNADGLIEGLGSGIAWSDAGGGWAFAEDRKNLLDALSGTLGQSYMKFSGSTRFPELPTGATVSWDSTRLDQVLALGDARKRFQTDLMPKFPASLQPGSAAMADTGLVESARDLLAQSYFVSGREMQAPSSDAGRARALRVRGWLEDMGATGVAEEISEVLVKDALSRLQLLDETLARAQAFVPRDPSFRGWNGEKAPFLDAFGAGDAAGLSGYVAQQDSFLDSIGKDAEGLLIQIGNRQPGNPLVARWQAVMTDLQRFRLKSPTSSLMALEQYVLTGATDVDGANCTEKLPARLGQRRGGDLFAERLQTLQSGLGARCRELSQRGFDDAWNRFATAFNRDLSNRSPFRTVSMDVTPKNERGGAADVDDVGNVLRLFERVPTGPQLGRDGMRSDVTATLKNSDDQMQAVHDLLAPLYPADAAQPGGLDVSVEFRANQGAEVDGNKIIDWTVAIGGQALHQRDPARPLRWEPGMPVALTLRLAQDGPVLPKPDAAQADMAVDQRTVTYRFDDPWALLSFVSVHRDLGAPTRSPLLRFEFPVTQVAEGGRVQARDARARVYVRLTLSPPGKRTALVWPGAFPIKIPTW